MKTGICYAGSRNGIADPDATAIQAATEADIVPLLGTHAKDIYTAVQADKKCKNKDFSVVYRYIGGKEDF